MPTRTFTAPAGAPDQPAKEPTEFKLEGTRTDNNEKWAETFHCIELLPPAVLDDLVSASSIDGKGNRVFHTPSLLAFLRGALVDEDVERFNLLMRDAKRAVPIETVGEIVLWLAEELAGRPTGP